MKKASLSSILVAVVLAALGVTAEAQQPKKLFRIGLHTGGGGDAKNPGRYFEVFRQALRDLGYVEGKNLHIEYRFGDGKGAAHEAQLAEELVRQNLDAIVITTRPAIQSAMNASKTIPIVMVTSADPVAAGLVKSLAWPGGNVTGVTRMTRELSGKRLELLKEMLPGLSRVGILMASDASTGDEELNRFEGEARPLKVSVTRLEIRPDKPDIAATFDAADATVLPWETDMFDVTVSGLVLNFVPDHQAMACEMVRVTKAGGKVAAYVWDYGRGMEICGTSGDAAIAVSPSDSKLDQAERFPICRPELCSRYSATSD